MKKLARVFLMLLVLLVCVMVGGCSVQYNVRLTDGGIVQSELYFDLTGLEQEKIDNVNKYVKAYFRQLENAYKENLVSLFSNIYNFDKKKDENGNELSLIKKYKYIITRNMHLLDGDDVDKDRAYEEFNKGKKFVITKTYASIYAYMLYLNPSAFEYDADKKKIIMVDEYNSLIDVPISSNELKKESNLFEDKYIQTCSPFLYNGEEPKFLTDDETLEISKDATLESVLLEKCELTQEQVELIFKFTSPYQRLHSNGQIEQTEKGFTHTWSLGSVNEKVTFTRIYADHTMWYVTAAGAGVVCILIGLIVAVFMHKHNKKVGLQVLKQIDDFTKANKFKIKK